MSLLLICVCPIALIFNLIDYCDFNIIHAKLDISLPMGAHTGALLTSDPTVNDTCLKRSRLCLESGSEKTGGDDIADIQPLGNRLYRCDLIDRFSRIHSFVWKACLISMDCSICIYRSSGYSIHRNCECRMKKPSER
jgi:hypothetical protein